MAGCGWEESSIFGMRNLERLVSCLRSDIRVCLFYESNESISLSL